MRAALLLLADARLPSGGHAHSGGIEAAVRACRVRDLASLELFLAGRASTVGTISAGLAAAACTGRHPWTRLDVAADARTASPAQRAASRVQGRALARAARAAWPGPILDALAEETPHPHHAVALGAAASAAGLAPVDAALVAAYGSVAGPASAAVRLLGLDPLAVAGIVASFGDRLDRIARAAVAQDLDELPASCAPLLDIDAEHHATWEGRLFAS
jgi:urease accessory protein